MMKRRSFSFTLLVVTAAVLSAGGGAQTTDDGDVDSVPEAFVTSPLLPSLNV